MAQDILIFLPFIFILFISTTMYLGLSEDNKLMSYWMAGGFTIFAILLILAFRGLIGEVQTEYNLQISEIPKDSFALGITIILVFLIWTLVKLPMFGMTFAL